MNTNITNIITKNSTMANLAEVFAGAKKAGRAPAVAYLERSSELIIEADGIRIYANGYATVNGKAFWVLDYIKGMPAAAMELPWLALIETARHIGEPYEKNDAVEMAVRALPVQQKNTIIMFYHWGSSFRTIADMDLCSVDTAFLNFTRAIQAIQKQIGGEA